MKDYLKQEIEVWDVIPAIRRDFARLMVCHHHLSQREAARQLNLTEAAISQYVQAKRARDLTFSARVVAEMKTSVGNVVKGKRRVVQEMQRICALPDIKMLVCSMHKARSTVPKNCRVCL